MKIEKKVALLQGQLIKSEEKIASLEEENEKLKCELLLEQNIPKEGYEKAKKLMEELTVAKEKYEKLARECLEVKRKYHDLSHDLLRSTKERNSKIDSITELLSKFAI